MIEVEHLGHAFHGMAVLKDVSFQVRAGEVVGYLGPNGAGKTTTLKILLGLVRPLLGRVRVFGLEPATNAVEVRSRLGYVPESGALYESLTPEEHLAFVGRLHRLPEALIRERTATFLEAFGLLGKARTRMTGFSKGMKQKVVLAAALIHDPELLLLDEPLTGLDANATLTVKEVLRGLAERGRTVLYSSHLMDVVERVTHRVIILDHGAIVADAAPEELRARTGDASLEGVFSRLTGGDDAQASSRGILDALGGPSSHAPA